MAQKQLIPITQVDQAGIIRDIPAHTLPPNAWSDGRNIFFKNGSVRKREGSVIQFDPTPHRVVHADWWPEPETLGLYFTVNIEAVESYADWNANAAYSVGDIVRYQATDTTQGQPPRYLGFICITAVSENSGGNTAPDFDPTHWRAYQIFRFELRNGAGQTTRVNPASQLQTADITDNDWQSTLFTGGHNLIINNTFDAPHYLDRSLSTFPRWVAGFAYNENDRVVYLGQVYQRTGNELPALYRPLTAYDPGNKVIYQGQIWNVVTAIPATNRTPPSASDTANWSADTPEDPRTSAAMTTPADRQWELVTSNVASLLPLPNWDAFTPPSGSANIAVTSGARVVRGIGNRLIAGSIRYFETNTTTGVRSLSGRLPGTVRISDIAPPGSVPETWGFGRNSRGAESLADEFEISNSAEIVDIQPLQGQAIVYTTNSIHSIQFDGAGNASQRTIADGYGALLTGAVLEFDGRHFVVGSDDLYIFGGHPGSIQSVADQKMREFFFEDLNPIPNVQESMFMIRDATRDEIQIYYPDNSSVGPINKMIAWNYRNNTWSINDYDTIRTGTYGPVRGGGIASATISFNPTDARFADPVEANVRGNPQNSDNTPLDAQREIQQITTNLPSIIEGPRREIQHVAYTASTIATDFDEEIFNLGLDNNALFGNPERFRVDFANNFSSGTGAPQQTGTVDEASFNHTAQAVIEDNIGGTGIDLLVQEQDRDVTLTGTASGVGANQGTDANTTVTPNVPANAASVTVTEDDRTGLSTGNITQSAMATTATVDGVANGATVSYARDASGVSGLTNSGTATGIGTTNLSLDGVADAATVTVADAGAANRKTVANITVNNATQTDNPCEPSFTAANC